MLLFYASTGSFLPDRGGYIYIIWKIILKNNVLRKTYNFLHNNNTINTKFIIVEFLYINVNGLNGLF